MSCARPIAVKTAAPQSMTTHAVACLLACWIVTGACGLAAESTIPVYSAAPAPQPPRIDGRLEDDAWRSALAVPDMHILGQALTAPRTTTFRLLYDAEALYFAAKCEIPPGKRLPKPTGMGRDTTIHDGPLHADECVELYLRPGAAGPYYHFILNHVAARYDARGTDASWSPAWTAAVVVTDACWQVEARIPWAAMEQGAAPAPGTNWTMNVTRNDLLSRKYYTWANLRNAAHQPDEFGSLLFAEKALGLGPIRVEREGTDLQVTIPWQAANVGAKAGAEIELRTDAGSYSFTPQRTSAAPGPHALSVTATNAWQADTGVWLNYSLTLDGILRYRSPGRLFPAGALPAAAPAAVEPITIRNDEVSLSFDRKTGKLLAAENRRVGLRMKFGERGIPVVELDTVSYISNPRFFRDEDVETVVPDSDTLREVTTRKTGEGETIEIKHLVGGSIPMTLTITVPPSGPETDWRIALENPLTDSPSKALVVHRVRYPSLPSVAGDACGTNPFFALPETMGRLYADPAATLGARPPLAYPHRLVMGYFDFYGERGGLYMKTGDLDPLPQTELITQSDPKARTLRLAIQRWPLCWPGDSWSPGPCSVALHEGDWHVAADLYRAWYRRNFQIAKPPPWLDDAQGCVLTGQSNYEFPELPLVLDNALASGLSYIQLWCEMTGGDTTYHAFPYPNPYMGTERDIKEAIAKIHAKGGHLGVYHNFNTGDPLLGTYLRQPRVAQKIPEDIPRPDPDYRKDGWLRQSLMNHTGSYSTWNQDVPGFLDGYWNQCPAAEKWTAFVYHWAIEKWAREYGVDVWYLDSCPVSRGSPCFACDHGHARPVPEGQSIIDFYKRLRAGAPKGFCLMQEYASDRLLPYATHALGLMWHVPGAHPEIVRYTLPEYPLFSGISNGPKGVNQFYPGETLTWQDAVKRAAERVFLIGNRYEFYLSALPPDLADPWRTRMVALRRACCPEMNGGDFLDTIGLGPTPKRVEARIFRRQDHGRLVVTLLDHRENSEAWDLSIDLSKVGAGDLGEVKLHKLDGTEEALAATVRERKALIRIPGFKGRVAALLVTVSPERKAP